MHRKPAATIPANNGVSGYRSISMARRRYQGGCLIQRGSMYYGQWREDFYGAQGKPERKLVCKPLGTTTDLPTKKLALRALRDQVSPVNSLDYRPKMVATFADLSAKWEQLILPSLSPANRKSVKSHLKQHIKPFFSDRQIGEIDGLLLQQFVSGIKLNPKSVKNVLSTLSIMWNSAKAWSYASHDPFAAVVIPQWVKQEQPCFTSEQMKAIVNEAQEPYRTLFWILAETGIRGGEVTALRGSDIMGSMIIIRQANSAGEVRPPKNGKPRCFPISERLASHLAKFHKSDALLFPYKENVPWLVDSLAKQHLHPILAKLKISHAGLHAFRHGNATIMDRISAPSKVRENRLGHYDSSLTQAIYTHTESQDERRVAEQIGEMLQ